MNYKTNTPKNIFKNCMNENNYFGIKNSSYRELFVAVSSKKTKIKEITLLSNPEGHFSGYISFSFNLEDSGLSEVLIGSCKQEISSPFFLSFWGELLVRENINEFVEKVSGIDLEEYLGTTNRTHTKFGIKKVGRQLTLTFHVELLRSLISEEFKSQLTK